MSALQADDFAVTEATTASQSTTTGGKVCRQRRRSSNATGGAESGEEGDEGISFDLGGVDLAPMSTLELLGGGCGKAASGAGDEVGCGVGVGGVGSGDYRGEPDPPTVLIDSDAAPPTAKQRRVARIVMAVAFALLAMCVILIGVTPSMSDRVDEMDKQRRLAEQDKAGKLPASRP